MGEKRPRADRGRPAAPRRGPTASTPVPAAAEAASAERDALLRLAQDVGRVGSLAWDLATGRGSVSPQWVEIHGLRPEQREIGYDEWLALVQPEDRARIERQVARALAERAPELRAEYRIVRPDSPVRWIEARLAYTYDGIGHPRRGVGVSIDITEQKDRQAELERRVAERTRALGEAAKLLAAEMRRREQAQAELVQSQKLEAVGQLTGGVAHDFNNVLMAISGSLQLLERRIGEPGPRRYLENARRATERGARLTRQLLAFARRQELKAAAIDLPALLANLDDFLRQAVGGRVRLTVECPADLWPLQADPHQLEMALVNLAVNARDAMPEGGELAISARNCPGGRANRPTDLPAGDHVAVAVRDTGAGMTPEVLARVLEPFYTTKERGRGTGLGLPMAHGFARQSGGTLRIESRPGAGTLVELYLPRLRDGMLEASTEPAELDRTLHGGATILLVDDDDLVRPVAAGLLRDLGYVVVEAAEAETAYALAHAAEALDLVVTDIAMPGADGPTLAARLRAEKPDLPVLFITGHLDERALGDELVLTKPFGATDLAARVLQALDRRPVATARPCDERILTRLRAPALRALLETWRRLGDGTGLPRFSDFDLETLVESDCLFSVAVEGDPDGAASFRYLWTGHGLTARLGRPLHGQPIPAGADPELLGGLEAAYRRCARSGAPTHEYARFDLGDGLPVLFERLLLPFSESVRGVTHLVGMAIFTHPDPSTSGKGRANHGQRGTGL